MKKWLAAFLGIFILSACAQNNPPVQKLPDLTFKHLTPIAIPVANIDVINKSQTSVAGKEISHRLPTTPVKAMTQWAHDRLKPVSTGGRAVFTILEASVVENKLQKTTGIKGLFSNDQSEKFDLTVEGRLDVYDAQGNPRGFSTAKAHRYITAAEDASLLDLEKKWWETLEKLMMDFDQTMVTNIRKTGF